MQYASFLAQHLKTMEEYEINCWRKSLCDPVYIANEESAAEKRFHTLHNQVAKLLPTDLSYEVSMEKHQEYAEKVYKATYCRPWTKLSIFHRRKKIEEYLSNLKYGKKISIQEKNENKNDLISRLEKNKNIDYDTKEGKIKDIPDLYRKGGIFRIR